MQKKRNCMVMTGMMVFMLTAVTGCGSGQDTGREAGSEITVIPVEESDGEDNAAQEQSNEAQHDASGSPVSDGIQDIDIVGGKVRSIAQESFVISRTLTDDDGYVIMPEAGSPEEQLVTIRCTDSTVFEHWTIQGGGAGIEKKEGFFSDIEEGGGLEAEGYFDGEDFVANKVIIEIYK